MRNPSDRGVAEGFSGRHALEGIANRIPDWHLRASLARLLGSFEGEDYKTMAKQVVKQFKLQAPGGTATPAPPIGPALGNNGVNPGQFIQQFNERTRQLNGKVVGCVITVYNDRSFDFEVKCPPAAVMIKDALGIEKGSGVPNKDKVGNLTREQLEGIAKEKMGELNAHDLDAACKVIAGTARSMGVTVDA